MSELEKALETGFSGHFNTVSVARVGDDRFRLNLAIGGRQLVVTAKAIAAGIVPADETHFVFNTWIEDPLQAFGRTTQYRMIDGWDSRHRPDDAVRSGLPADIAGPLREVGDRYVIGRWGVQPMSRAYA